MRVAQFSATIANGPLGLDEVSGRAEVVCASLNEVRAVGITNQVGFFFPGGRQHREASPASCLSTYKRLESCFRFALAAVLAYVIRSEPNLQATGAALQPACPS